MASLNPDRNPPPEYYKVGDIIRLAGSQSVYIIARCGERITLTNLNTGNQWCPPWVVSNNHNIPLSEIANNGFHVDAIVRYNCGRVEDRI